MDHHHGGKLGGRGPGNGPVNCNDSNRGGASGQGLTRRGEQYQKTTETQPARHWCFPPKSDVVPSNQSKALPVPGLNFTADSNQSNDSVLGTPLGVYKEREVRS